MNEQEKLIREEFFGYIAQIMTTGKAQDFKAMLERFSGDTMQLDGAPLLAMFEGFVAGWNAREKTGEEE